MQYNENTLLSYLLGFVQDKNLGTTQDSFNWNLLDWNCGLQVLAPSIVINFASTWSASHIASALQQGKIMLKDNSKKCKWDFTRVKSNSLEIIKFNVHWGNNACHA